MPQSVATADITADVTVTDAHHPGVVTAGPEQALDLPGLVLPAAAPLPAAAARRSVTPLMKWVGGKKRMLPHVTPMLGEKTRIVEPFFGGGAVSFALASARPGLEVIANEKLNPVVEIYNAVRDDVDAFIAAVDTYADPYLALDGKDARRAYYYRLREQYMTEDVDGPAPLFFMLWCAYSGLYRTGLKYPGRFNTSHGFGQEKAGFYKPQNLRAAAELMKTWTITSTDFAETLDEVDENTFVFLDPPYRETYDNYTPDGFSHDDQVRVAEYFTAAAAKGARLCYTNKWLGEHDTFYADAFAGFDLRLVPIRYQVNRNCADVGRPETYEVFITTG